MNPINYLVILSCQIEANNKLQSYIKINKQDVNAVRFDFVDKKESKKEDLIELINYCLLKLKKNDSNKDAYSFCAALKNVECYLERKVKRNFFQRILFKWIPRLAERHNKLDKILDKIHAANDEIKKIHGIIDLDISIKTEEGARCKFYSQFATIFKVTPQALKKNEAVLVEKISQKIWNSKNVQTNLSNVEKYQEYARLMTEFFIGTHMIFESGESEISILEDFSNLKVEIEKRVSSHYGKVGSEIHHHIRGNQLPEVLFHTGEFGVRPNDESLISGKYFKQLSDQEKQGAKKIKAFWIQTERTPDGPDWGSWLYHRSVDFVQYFFLKHVIKSKRPQIANYTAKQGRGLPDSNPIFIKNWKL